MLTEIVDNPALAKYLITIDTGQTLFLEGDDSADLYILVSGKLNVNKGNKEITEISERGSLFGEMSFLLGARRTATIKAGSEVKTLRIPKEEISQFLQKFPTAASEITRLLAQRLDETNQMLCGLKEFCDQIPDAVVLTEKEGNVLTWNKAAEKLYGREWGQIYSKPLESVYENPEEYREFLKDVHEKDSISERILAIRHPEKGTRFISVSATILYDGHHNYQGLLSLGRDVTDVKRLEKRYRRAIVWFAVTFILLWLLGGAIFLGYPYFTKGCQTMDVTKQALRNQLAKDNLLLSSLLADPLNAGDRAQAFRVLNEFFAIQGDIHNPYTGIVLLDRDKKIFEAYSLKSGTDAKNMIGNSYADIEFQGNEASLHRVLTLFRADKANPMGRKSIEIAFEIKREDVPLGWLLFQMDMDRLANEYSIDEEGLKQFQFKGP